MDATMENKMGLPPPYASDAHHPPPPPPAYTTLPPHSPPPSAPPPALPHTVVLTPGKLGPGPTGLACPHCRASIVTTVEYTPNTRTHIISTVLCLVAGCCCLCCLPYAMRSCKVANHYCPGCKAYIGSRYPS